MSAHAVDETRDVHDELSAQSIESARKLAQSVARQLRRDGLSVATQVSVNPYLDARADLLATDNNGLIIVVEVKPYPPTVRVQTDMVQQAQHMTRLLERERGAPAVGLLVTTGAITALARSYAAGCSPRVYVAEPGDVGQTLAQIRDDRAGSMAQEAA
jgi:hypothetical protein